MTIRTSAGSLTDALMSLYTGSCSSLTYTNICEDDNTPGNGSYMPVIGVNGPVGTEVYIRVWGYGNSVGTFSICILNYNSQNFGNTPANDVMVIAPITEIKTVSEKAETSSDKELEVRSQSMVEFVPVRQLVHTCDVLVNGLEISAFNVDPKSEYFLYNTVGSILCQGKAIDGSIHCSANTSGVYFMSIIDEMGNRCVQKIFVN